MIGAILSPKQAKFVAEYLVDGNGSRAALAAGYGESGRSVAAVRLLGNASVRAAIETRQAVDSQRLGLARQNVIQGLLEAVQMARQQANPGAMVSAWVQLARLMGFYQPERHQVDLAVVSEAKLMAHMVAMSDAELMAVVG